MFTALPIAHFPPLPRLVSFPRRCSLRAHAASQHHLAAVALLVLAATPPAAAQGTPRAPRFEVGVAAAAGAEPLTGRVFVIVTRDTTTEPRLQTFSWGDAVPFFGVDVSALAPGHAAIVDASTPGYPVRSLADLPPGDYAVQAVLNVYTEFHRADGHVIWAHMDQWEGQQWNISPGNLVSAVQRVHLDPRQPRTVRLTLAHRIPPIPMPPDSRWVKHVKIQSPMLTRFWGRPIYLGAVVLLPRGYDAPGDTTRYPAIYQQGHFSLGAPFGFATAGQPETPEQRARRRLRTEREPGYEFAQSWMSDDFPRMVAITFQHPTPYYDDSYAVNSVNDGPYGDAIVQELIPYLERHFRLLPASYARLLIGGSTGGWEAAALQIQHPYVFGGAWAMYPDPVDFRRYQMSDMYSDTSAFVVRRNAWISSEVPAERGPDGMPVVGIREESQLEAVLGTRGRSGEQLEAWEAVWGPIGADGYPRVLWDKRTGHIDHDVAGYMRDHGYDLRWYLAQHWATLAPPLRGKLHFVVGDMDNYYLNLAVYLMQDFLEHATPPADATFDYGRPMKPHGWQPWTNADFVRMASDQVRRQAAAQR